MPFLLIPCRLALRPRRLSWLPSRFVDRTSSRNCVFHFEYQRNLGSTIVHHLRDGIGPPRHYLKGNGVEIFFPRQSCHTFSRDGSSSHRKSTIATLFTPLQA